MATPNKNMNKEILALFSGQSSMLTTPKLYVQLTGSHSLAIILNQCVFWANKSESSDGWFHKEYHEWFDEINIPERTLRRRFDRLEQYGWITTKVKKVRGINVKHIYTHTERIIESISIMMSTECPNRPLCPVKTEKEQKTCTNITPTGQLGRLEPATLSDSSIYTDDNIQIKSTNCNDSSSFFFSEILDQNLLSQKLNRDERTDDEFMDNVVDHVENHSDKQYSRIVRAQAALKLLTKMKKENVIFYSQGRQPKQEEKTKNKQSSIPFTEKELALVGDYNHARKMVNWGCKFEVYMPNPERAKQAEAIIQRMKSMEESKSCQAHLPRKTAKEFSSKSE